MEDVDKPIETFGQIEKIIEKNMVMKEPVSNEFKDLMFDNIAMRYVKIYLKSI